MGRGIEDISIRSKEFSRGFTLLELAISVVIIGLIMAGILSGYAVSYKKEQLSRTQKNIESVNDAITAFQQEYGYLPCPADPNDPAMVAGDCSVPAAAGTNPATGLAAANTGVAGQRMRMGVIPITVLNAGGIAGNTVQLVSGEQAVDGWNNRLAYAIVEGMGVPGGMLPGVNGSLSLIDRDGNAIDGTAKYLVLSRGEDGIGAYSKTGALRNPCAGGSQDVENCNADSSFRSIGVAGTRSTSGDNNNFDDFVLGDTRSNRNITCADNQEYRGFNWRTRQPVCVPRSLSCGANTALVGTTVDPVSKAISPVCRSYTAACPTGYLMAELDDIGPRCVRNVTAGCPAGYVQTGTTAYNDNNTADRTDDTVAAPICSLISKDCGPDQLQVGVSDGRGGIPSGQPICANRMKNDTCSGQTILVGYNPNGTPQCSAAPACTGGNVVSGINNGALMCSTPPGTGSQSCTNGQVVVGMNNGNITCGFPQQSEQLGMPLYAKYTNPYGRYDIATGGFPYGQWNEYNAVLEAGISAVINPGTYNGDLALMEQARNMWRSECYINGSGQLPTPSDDVTGEYCGRFVCYAESGVWPFMARVGDRCNEGSGNTCNWNHFFQNWACLSAAQ